MVCVGYDNKKSAFKIANSWGTKWADDGFCWIDYDFFMQIIKERGAAIGIVVPNNRQRVIMGISSQGACGKGNWGDIVILNNSQNEIAVEILGDNYENNDVSKIDAEDEQLYSGIPSGKIKVKIYSADKKSFKKEFNVTVSSGKEAVLTVE